MAAIEDGAGGARAGGRHDDGSADKDRTGSYPQRRRLAQGDAGWLRRGKQTPGRTRRPCQGGLSYPFVVGKGLIVNQSVYFK